MGLFKSLVDKMKGTKDELEKRAAKKAAEVALEQAKKTARGAIDSAGDALERAIFGDVEKKEENEEKPEPPDPFAHLKAREKERSEREKVERERKKNEARVEKEVDDELAALKKKLGKK